MFKWLENISDLTNISETETFLIFQLSKTRTRVNLVEFLIQSHFLQIEWKRKYRVSTGPTTNSANPGILPFRGNKT